MLGVMGLEHQLAGIWQDSLDLFEDPFLAPAIMKNKALWGACGEVDG